MVGMHHKDSRDELTALCARWAHYGMPSLPDHWPDERRWLYALAYLAERNLLELSRMENAMSALRDQLSAVETELADAITAVAERIAALPGAVSDITQADIDALKADAAALAAIDQSAPPAEPPATPPTDVPPSA